MPAEEKEPINNIETQADKEFYLHGIIETIDSRKDSPFLSPNIISLEEYESLLNLFRRRDDILERLDAESAEDLRSHLSANKQGVLGDRYLDFFRVMRLKLNDKNEGQIYLTTLLITHLKELSLETTKLLELHREFCTEVGYRLGNNCNRQESLTTNDILKVFTLFI